MTARTIQRSKDVDNFLSEVIPLEKLETFTPVWFGFRANATAFYIKENRYLQLTQWCRGRVKIHAGFPSSLAHLCTIGLCILKPLRLFEKAILGHQKRHNLLMSRKVWVLRKATNSGSRNNPTRLWSVNDGLSHALF